MAARTGFDTFLRHCSTGVLAAVPGFDTLRKPQPLNQRIACTENCLVARLVFAE
jgi:hypothetical protein